MHLSSSRALKEEILTRAYRLPGERRSERRYRLRRAASGATEQVSVVEPTPVAAVGIAPGDGKEYKLAVRIFKGHARDEAALLEGFERHRKEMDIRRGLRYQPRLTVRAGSSCGHYKITAGTLGGFVEDDQNYYMLSNNHVLANSNQCFGADPILLPGPADVPSGDSPDTIGLLDRWYPLSKEDRNGVDAAVARFSDDVDFFYPWAYTGIGTIKKAPVQDRWSVTKVIKRGRTTKVTRGRVSAYELDGIVIDYGTAGDPARVTFDDQIEIVGDPPSKPFSLGGDSGSFIIDRDSLAPYALLYGGGRDSQGIDRTVAQFMPTVLKAMKVRLVQ